MGFYVPNTEKQQREMLMDIGLDNFDELFSQIPEEVLLSEGLDIPRGMSEIEVAAKTKEIARKNRVFGTCLRGAGAYRHYIPAIVNNIVNKEEFKTAYTPYQAELSQGILQSIFEYQTMICELTGMDVSNASVYDGAVAAAEAAMMCRDRRRGTVMVSATIHPNVLKVMRTYCGAAGAKLVIVPMTEDNRMDLRTLREELSKEEKIACLYVQQPNFFGILEEFDGVADIVHEAGAKFIMGCNPISLGILRTPKEYGADIAVGEGQPLGMPLSFGGPYLGFMAAEKSLMRKLPGRIVGQTTDADGERAFVLTLQAREQHIRREKASSNICSNEALCALTASVYMAAMGPEGLARAARMSMENAHCLAEKLTEAGLLIDDNAEFFNEFVTEIPESAGVSCGDILAMLERKDILGGLPLDDRKMLWCATEVNTISQISEAADVVRELLSDNEKEV